MQPANPAANVVANAPVNPAANTPANAPANAAANAAGNITNNAANADNARETPLQTRGKMQEPNLHRCKQIVQKVVSVNA
jgi:hypothetical protein